MRHTSIGLILSAGIAFAQGAGAIHGTVTDPSGLAMARAAVTATHDERGATRTAVTGADGGYVLTALPVGAWTIRIESQGFKSFRQAGVSVTTNQNVRVDARLEIGAVAESVQVTGEAPLVDTRSSTVGTLIDSRRVLELPMNGRNVIALAGLLPGATQVAAPQMFTGDRSGPTLSMAGSRGNQNLFLFDGQHFNAVFRNTGLNYPPPDALQEVKVLTNTYSAEYGRNAGSVFNVVTKSGSNKLHGSAWEFLRNHKLNARNFFAPSVKPQLIQNQFGAAAGGPVRRDKLFVFGSWESLRVRPASLNTSAFPLTAEERAGRFTGNVRDPLTGQPFPNATIPAARIDPVARSVNERIPLPNRPGGQLVETYPLPQNNDQFVVRVDWNFGRHTIDGRYNVNLANERDAAGQVPSYAPLDREALVQSITIGDTFNWRPTVLNQARISFNRIRSDIVGLADFYLGDLGANFPLLGPKIPPNLNISGRVNLGSNSVASAINVNEAFQLDEAVTWNRGSHTVKGGFQLLKLRYLNRSYSLVMGSFNFTGTFSANPAADFLLGRAENFSIASPVLEQAGLQDNAYWFIQDDWRVNRRLTINAGLRYELAFPWVHPQDFWATLRLGQQSQKVRTAPPGLVFPGDPGIPRGLIATDRNNFAPRFGLVWDPFGGGRTSVRAAYGLFYEVMNSDIIQNTSQPFRYTFTFQAPPALQDPLRGQPQIPFSVNLSNPQFIGLQQIFFPDPSLRSPYVHQFNLNIQREITRDFAIRAGYAGKLGRKLLMGLSANPAVFRPGATLANLDSRRLNTAFGNNSVISSQANSRFHGFEFEATKRFSRGFSLNAAYTWSRSIDMASAIALGAAVPNVFNLRTQYGLSDFHAKHIGSFSWLWEIPTPAALPGFAKGWQFNGLFTARSGHPLNIVTGTDIALSGTPNQRPNVVGDHRLPSGRSRAEQLAAWFNRAAFANPAAGSYGNAGRNALLSPSQQSTNLSVFKNFPLPFRENMRLQFRSEFFSVFNMPTLGAPSNAVNAGARMGQITSAGGARVIQFALKVLF